MIYVTKSGSTYEVDGLKVRRVVRSKLSASERVSEQWREALEITQGGIGHPLVIVWGFGEDDHSKNAIQMGEGGLKMRCTVTTPVVEIGS